MIEIELIIVWLIFNCTVNLASHGTRAEGNANNKQVKKTDDIITNKQGNAYFPLNSKLLVFESPFK